jgi:hypothetical protein
MAARKRLGEILLESGIIDVNQLQAALGHQRRWGGRLGQTLVDLKIASEPEIVEALSRMLGYAVVRTDAIRPGHQLEAALKLLPQDFALRYNVLPYAADTASISVAMSDPSNVDVVDEIRFRTGRRVRIALAGDRELSASIRRLYGIGEAESESIAFQSGEEAGAPPETVMETFGGGTIEAFDEYYHLPSAGSPAPSARPAVIPPRPAASPPPPPVALVAPAAPAPEPPRRTERAPAPPAVAPAPAAAARPAAQPPVAPRRVAAAPPPVSAPVAAPPPAAAPPAAAPAAAAPAAGAQAPAAPADAAGASAAFGRRASDILDPSKDRSSRVAAALVRLLIRKKLITAEEFLEEFMQK